MSAPRTFLDGRVTLHAGDCREVLREMGDNSVDSVVVDPPYHLTSIVKRFGRSQMESGGEQPPNRGAQYKRLSRGFMSKTWDGGDIAFQPELWAEVLRVLKPGGYIMAFSGCRTYHRMACAIEDAGFVTHPMFAWVTGQGFPKAYNLSKQLDKMAGAEREVVAPAPYKRGRATQSYSETRRVSHDYPPLQITAPATDAAREWDGWFYGTQSLKPAIEPVYFGQKPFERGFNGAQNVMKWGVGAINVGGCKIPCSDLPEDRKRHGGGVVGNGSSYELPDSHGELGPSRWPANLIHDGSDEVLACFPETTSNKGTLRSNVPITNIAIAPERQSGTILSDGDSGSAARFFASFPQEDVSYVPNGKNNVYGQNMGGGYHPGFKDSGSVARLFYTSKADKDDRLGSRHPTVKPLDLIQYLVRLVTPQNGVCLDLFAGTGTTGEACFREGFRAILIEREAEYIGDIERRMSLVMSGPVTRANAGMKARGRPRDDGPLFAEAAE